MTLDYRGAEAKRAHEKMKRGNTASLRATCEECGRRGGVLLRTKLNPRNWHEIRKRLCGPCGKRLEFTTGQVTERHSPNPFEHFRA